MSRLTALGIDDVEFSEDELDYEDDSVFNFDTSSLYGSTDTALQDANRGETGAIKRNFNSELSVQEYQILREFSRYPRDGGNNFKFYTNVELIDLISKSLSVENSLVSNITEKLISSGYLSKYTLLTSKGIGELVDWDPKFVFTCW